jgi:hypothetical protein
MPGDAYFLDLLWIGRMFCLSYESGWRSPPISAILILMMLRFITLWGNQQGAIARK